MESVVQVTTGDSTSVHLPNNSLLGVEKESLKSEQILEKTTVLSRLDLELLRVRLRLEVSVNLL